MGGLAHAAGVLIEVTVTEANNHQGATATAMGATVVPSFTYEVLYAPSATAPLASLVNLTTSLLTGASASNNLFLTLPAMDLETSQVRSVRHLSESPLPGQDLTDLTRSGNVAASCLLRLGRELGSECVCLFVR